MLLSASSSLHFSSSSLIFLHPKLDKIAENSYELSINQHNYDVKIDMMVEAYETCKTTKNNLETKSVILMDLRMSIGLNNMISMKKNHSKPILNRTQNSTFWVLIIHLNRHIASLLVMLKIKKGCGLCFCKKSILFKKCVYK